MNTRPSQTACRFGWTFGVLALWATAACGGDPSPPAGGDGGESESDGGTPIAAGDTATWSISGAQSASRAHRDELNYVSCALTSSGLLDMTSAEFAGGDPAITVRIRAYSGPGSFDFTYAPGSTTGATADVRLSGGHSYWYFYDYSTVDFSEIPSTCSITVSEPDPGVRIHATISCANLVAQITSPDYDDRDAAGFRPDISLTATFDCDI